MNRYRTGFTLLEVLVALAILAISLAAAVKGVSSYASNATYLRDRTLSHWVAMNQVAEHQLQKEWPPVGKREGTVTQGGFEWRWRAIVTETVDKDLHRLDIEVRARKNDADPIAIATAFLGRPRLTP